MTVVFYFLLILTNLMMLAVLVSQRVWLLSGYVFLLLACMTAYLIALTFRKISQKPGQVPMRDLALAFLAAALPTMVFLTNMHSYSLWLDEYTNAMIMGTLEDIFHQAAALQQPPLAYYWGRLSMAYYGLTESGARMYTVVAGFLFLFAMFFNLIKLTADRLYSFLGTLFLGLNVWIILYAVEARPYMVSLFYFSVMLHFLLELVLPEEKSESFRELAAGLMCSALLWLLSISMQPLFFICVLMLSLVSWGAFRREKTPRKIAFTLAVSLLLHLPVLVYIVASSQAYMKTTPFSPAESLHHAVANLLKLAHDFGYNLSNAFLYGLMMAVICSALAAVKKQRRLLWSAFFISGAFVLAVVLAFTVKIKWNFAPRYLITAVPLFYLLFLYSLSRLGEKWTGWTKNLFLFCLVLFSAVGCVLEKPIKQNFTDWRGLYQKIESLTDGTGKAYMFSFTGAMQWYDAMFITSEFYSGKKVRFPVMADYEVPGLVTNDLLFSDLQNGEKTTEFYFVISAYTMDPDFFLKFSIPNSKLYFLRDFYLIKVNEPSGLLPAAKAFFREAERIMWEFPKKIHIYDGLFRISEYEKDCANMKKYFARVSALTPAYGEFYVGRLSAHSEKLKELCKQDFL